MEKKILDCVLDALSEELGCVGIEEIIDTLNELFKVRKIPYQIEIIENEEEITYGIKEVITAYKNPTKSKEIG